MTNQEREAAYAIYKELQDLKAEINERDYEVDMLIQYCKTLGGTQEQYEQFRLDQEIPF